MKIAELMMELKKLPLDHEIEYHEGNNYQVASAFKFEISKRKKGHIIMQVIE